MLQIQVVYQYSMMEYETILDGKWCLHKDTEGQLPTSRAKQATHVYVAILIEM